MAYNPSAIFKGSVPPKKRFNYSDEFSRILYIVDEINNTKFFGGTHPNFNKLFLAGYIPRIENRSDIITCFQELPKEFSHLQEKQQVEPARTDQGKKEDSEHKPKPIQLCNFLLLLRELRSGLESGTIDPDARWDILQLFLNIVGPKRELISRVLYYLYPPPGPFVPKEEPGGPSAMADARSIHPTENLAFSLVYRTQNKLQRNEYRRYLSIWVKVRVGFENGRFGKKESKEAWRKFSEVLSAYKDLMRILSKIPWPHLADKPAVGDTPATPTRKSSTDEKISGRST